MRTRCQRMEVALAAERVHIWTDLSTVLQAGAHESSPIVLGCVRRIRYISEALGYPAEWKRIPWHIHPWYAPVEHFPDMGLYVRDFPELDVSEVEAGRPLSYPSDELLDLLTTHFDPDDPDGWALDG